MAILPISPRATKKKQISVRLSYAAIDMLHYLKQQSGLPQESIIERLIVAEAQQMEESRTGRAKAQQPQPTAKKRD